MKRFLLLAIVLIALSLAWAETTLLNESFAALDGETADGTADISASLNSYTDTDGFTGTKIYKSIGRLKMGSSSGLGSITTPTVDLSANSGEATLSFSLLQYGTDAGKLVQVMHAADGTNFSQVGSDITIPATVNTFTVNITGGTASSKLKIQAKLAASNRFYLDNILLTQGSSGGLATVSTVIASAITQTAASSGGNVTSEGGSSVTAKGVCWNSSANPTISNYLTNDGTGTGSFVSSLTSLSASTLYYYRAYATNSQGTAYGEEYSFTTSGVSPPAVPTATAATAISSSSFTANWDAASGATSYRLDVSTSNTFGTLLTNYNNLTVTGTSQVVSGLSANSPYYYRVRSYNSNGTSTNSNTISVSTLASDPYNGYYNSVAGLSGSTLKNGLHTILHSTHTTQYSYSNLETQMKITDEDPNNSSNVIEIYTGWSVPKSNYGGGVTDWNKEHTWSKSHGDFGDTAPAGTDLHHLRPCDATVNSFKSNRDFDNGTTSYTDASPPSGYTGATGCKYSTADDFEPRDADKGDVARMIFYMAVRYDGVDTSYDLELVDHVYSDEGTNEPFYGKLSTLLAWHNADPPDAWEALRNNRIQNLQGNRNPFIDHPEYVASIWGGAAPTTSVQFTETSATVSEADGSITLTVQISNPSATTATSVQVQLSSGSADDVGNYSTRTITFPANSSANQTTSITITDDALLEDSEALVFSLVNVSGGSSAAIGANSSFTLTITANDIPTVVANAASDIGYTGFTANWEAASGITDYQFDLSTDYNFGSFVGAYQNYAVSSTSLALSGLTEGSTYYYRIRAVYNASYGLYSNIITTQTTAIIVIDAPLAVDATAVSHEGFTARWEAVAGADGYRLDVYSGSGGALTTDLLISEYVEGSSNNKYIEIYNGTGADVDLAAYKLKLYSNGSSSVTNFTALTGTLANNACVVYKNSGAVLTLPEGVSATVSTATNFNGNDTVALTKTVGADDILVDIFGNIGDATSWSSGTISATNQTLRRKSTVLSGVAVDPIDPGFPTLGTEWDSFAIDTADGLGSHSTGGTATPVAGYQDLAVSTNVVRVNNLEAETSYTYRVCAYNSSFTTANSNTIEVQTTAVNTGIGANTCINGAQTTVLIPALIGYSNNDVSIDPTLGSSDDFAVTVSSITDGIRYSISSSNADALNASYILAHNGLGFTPATVFYRFDGVEHSAGAFSSDANQTSLSVSGLVGSGTLEIDLLPAPQALDTPVVTINVSDGLITLSWEEIPNAESYRIESCDTPDGIYTSVGTTSLLSWSQSASASKFFRVIALRD